MTARPWAGELGHELVHRGLGADVDALGRLVEDDDAGLGGEPLGDHHLLLVAAGELGDVLVERGGAEVEAGGVLAGEAELLGEAQEAAARGAGERRQGDVLEDRQADDRALAAAVLGHVDDAVGDRVGGAADRGEAAVDPDLALRGLRDAEERLHELAAPGADQAVEAEDLAVAQGEADVLELGRVAVAGDLQHLLADPVGALGEDRVDRAADHHGDELVLGDVGDAAFADEAAVAEDGVAVGDAEDLVELVADEEDRLALGLQHLDQLVELGDLLVRERGGRLVHDDDAGVDRKGAGDGDEVLVGDAEVAQPGPRVDALRADAGEHGAGVVVHPLPVDEPEAGAGGVAEEDVLGDRELVEEHGLLVDRGDAGRGGGVGGREVRRAGRRGRSRLRRAGRCRSGS